MRSEDLYSASEITPVSLKVVGRIDPGDAKYISIGRGEAVEISTGAPIPPGADSVLMVEYTKRSGGEVVAYKSVTPGENIMPSGSDIMLGELVLRRCTVIGEREVGVLASIGVKRIRVYRRPRVVVISTGKELIPP